MFYLPLDIYLPLYSSVCLYTYNVFGPLFLLVEIFSSRKKGSKIDYNKKNIYKKIHISIYLYINNLDLYFMSKSNLFSSRTLQCIYKGKN